MKQSLPDGNRRETGVVEERDVNKSKAKAEETEETKEAISRQESEAMCCS